MRNLNYLTDHILYWIFNTLQKLTENTPIRIYITKTENRIISKIKTGYYLELLTPETMKLLRSTKSKTAKNENGENVRHLKITEAVLVHCNFISNYHQHDTKVLKIFVRNKSLGQLLDI